MSVGYRDLKNPADYFAFERILPEAHELSGFRIAADCLTHSDGIVDDRHQGFQMKL
jgi:hypothetical protein